MKTLYARPLLAAILAGTLVAGPISPAFGQDAPQTPQAAPAKTAAPIVPVSLGSAKHNYSRSPRMLPNLLAPYTPIQIEAPASPIRRALTSLFTMENWNWRCRTLSSWPWKTAWTSWCNDIIPGLRTQAS